VLCCSRSRGSPHRSHDTLEPDEQHCRREVYRLVRLVTITLRRLARTEEREKRALEVELHKCGHGQNVVIAEMERAVERLRRVLESMTRDVYEGCGWERRRRLRSLRHRLGRGCILDPGFLDNRADISHLRLDLAERGQTCVGGVLGGD
jgi:hypothetical protein